MKLESGEKCNFSVKPSEKKDFKMDTMEVSISGEGMPRISIKTLDSENFVESVSYKFYLDMRNYSKVIAADSGRWFLRYTSLIDFWRNCREFKSDISDIKMPLFIFLNAACNAETQ